MLDAFGRRLADQDAVVAPHVVRNCLVEAVTADTYRRGIDDAVQRNDGNLGRAAPDVEHHRAPSLVHRHARANGSSHRFVDQEHLASAGALGRFANRAPLDLRRAVRNADQDARARAEIAVAVRLPYKVLQHLLGDREVGDNAVFQGADRGDVAWRAAQHVLGFGAHSFDDPAATAGIFANRYHRRFVEDDAVAARVDEGIGGAKVDRQVIGKITQDVLEHGGAGPEARLTVQSSNAHDIAQGGVYHCVRVPPGSLFPEQEPRTNPCHSTKTRYSILPCWRDFEVADNEFDDVVDKLSRIVDFRRPAIVRREYRRCPADGAPATMRHSACVADAVTEP